MQEFFSNKVIPAIMKFVSLKGVVALKDGLLYTMPLTIVGSVFLLLANFPVPAVVNWFDSMGWIDPLNQAYGATFNIIALIGVIGIAYKYVKNEGYEALNAGVLAAVTFILTTDSFVVTESGEIVSNVINKTWTAGQGMISAIIIGLLVGWIYSWFMKNDIRIKMPAGVPEGVANSFTALIPGFVIVTGATLIYSFFKFVLDTTFIEAVYAFIQTPLQGLTDSLGGVIVMSLMIPFLWFFGLHGANMVDPLMQTINVPAIDANIKALEAGKAIPYIVNKPFFDSFVNLGGTGATLGLLIAIFIVGRRNKPYKIITNLSLAPGLFNINEPVMFGLPIVLNPIMFIPFILVPMVLVTVAYVATATGLVPAATFMPPWVTPPIIGGFLATKSIAGGVLAAVNLLISILIYMPFVKVATDQYLKQEAAAEAAE